MLTIDEYIARRKKEDKLNEFDKKCRDQNLKSCVDYVFEYFDNYIDFTKVQGKIALQNEILNKYRKQLRKYDEEIIEWLVGIYRDYGKQVKLSIEHEIKKDALFFLYNTDKEFRSLSYDCYAKLINRFHFLKEETEKLFVFIKNYHRVKSTEEHGYTIPSVCEKITLWIDETWNNYRVSIPAFASTWADNFFKHDELWPVTHKTKTTIYGGIRNYDYNYKINSNLIGIDTLYGRMPKKSFIRGRKKEFEILIMYYWLHQIVDDPDNYWEEYLNEALPIITKTK